MYTATLNGEHVAIKMVRSQSDYAAKRDLRSEAALLTDIGRRPHRHVLQLVGEGCDDSGRPFLVLELLSSTLADALPKPRVTLFGVPTEPDEVGVCQHAYAASRWPLVRALHVAYQLALGLKYLHEEDAIPGKVIIHRDLKPDNVGFLASDGSVVLFDLGLATSWERHPATGGAGRDDKPPRKLTGQTGSTRYMAPEVALSKPYSGSAEVFSFGLILWQLASHDRPFRGLSEADHTRRVAKGGERPPLPSSWPPALKQLLRDCWRAEPSERPDFSSVVHALEKLLQSQQASGSKWSRRQEAGLALRADNASDSSTSSTSELAAVQLNRI